MHFPLTLSNSNVTCFVVVFKSDFSFSCFFGCCMSCFKKTRRVQKHLTLMTFTCKNRIFHHVVTVIDRTHERRGHNYTYIYIYIYRCIYTHMYIYGTISVLQVDCSYKWNALTNGLLLQMVNVRTNCITRSLMEGKAG